MMHMAAAGFDIDVATLSGNSIKLEMWAMPGLLKWRLQETLEKMD